MLEDGEDGKVTTFLRTRMRMIDRHQERQHRRSKYEDLGLCSKCMYLHAETTKYGTRRQWCRELDRRLFVSDPIEDCTSFEENGMMPLSMMMSLAIPIDISNKQPAGFIYSYVGDFDPDRDDI